MGIHQYQLEVVPMGFLGLKAHEFVPSALMQSGLDPWSASLQPMQEVLNGLRILLPINTSWGDVEEYESKTDWGSDIRIWKESELVENIDFRYSPMGDPWTVMREFLNIVRSGNYVLVERQTGIIMLPEEEIVGAHIRLSRAWKISGPPSDFPYASHRKPN